MVRRISIVLSAVLLATAGLSCICSFAGVVLERSNVDAMRRYGLSEGCFFIQAWEAEDWDDQGNRIVFVRSEPYSTRWWLGDAAKAVATHYWSPWRPTWMNLKSPPVLVFSIPLWIPILMFLILPSHAILHSLRRLRRSEEGQCVHCGYDLRGQAEPRCPECGKSFDEKLMPRSGA